MKGFDVLKVKSAVKARNKFDLSFSHLTTMDFGQIMPLCVEETVPGDKFRISAEYFSRMAPLVRPTYGKFSFRTVAGFVPYHQVADDIEAWFAGKTTWEGTTPKFRYITMGNLEGFISGSCVEQASSIDDSDFTWLNNAGTAQFSKFTPYGRMAVKVLTALGYPIPQGVSYVTTSDWWSTERFTQLSALPLLAFFKLYNDYMSQSQRFNTSVLTRFLREVKHGIADTNYWTADTGSINYNGIKLLFDNLRLAYDNDYFTSAWQSPNSALGTSVGAVQESISSVTVPGGSQGTLSSNSNYNYLYAPQITSTSTTLITQRALDMLRDFDNWVRRNNYSGSRAVQQLYSRFGIKADDYKSNYAHIIKKDVLPVQVGDVTSMADSEGAILGDYAGKGIMSGNGGLSYDADDFGCLIVLGYFTVNPMDSYGADRRVLRNSPLDYYNPEFDGLGAEAISYGELYQNPLGICQGDTTLNSTVFGYTERYNSYRFGRDVITGEFRKYQPDNDMNTWHTGRNLNDVRKSLNMYAQSSSMNTLEQTDSQYNRIFSVTDAGNDHFYLTCRFNVSAIRPMLNLNQVVNLGEGDTNVPRNGNVVS